MDKLLSSFIRKYINDLNDNDLRSLNDLLDLDDENLYRLNQGKELSIKIDTNEVTELFKN